MLFIYLNIYLSIRPPIYLSIFLFLQFLYSLCLQCFSSTTASVSLLTYAFVCFHVCAPIVLIWTVMATEYM